MVKALVIIVTIALGLTAVVAWAAWWITAWIQAKGEGDEP